MSEEEIKKEFGILKPDLEAWGKFVDQIIKNIIRNYRYGEIQIFPKYRLKNEQSSSIRLYIGEKGMMTHWFK